MYLKERKRKLKTECDCIICQSRLLMAKAYAKRLDDEIRKGLEDWKKGSQKDE
jgi:hypothetical protein